MRPVCVFYHCLFNGTARPINTAFAIELMTEQMQTLENCGLAGFASAIYVGVNGDEEDANIARLLAPSKAKVIAHGAGACTEITTMNVIKDWVKTHQGWNVLYFHMKGVSHPESPNTRWRLNMEKHVLHDWRMCVLDLDKGMDCCGSYWLTPEAQPHWVQRHPFFGGTMWWAKSEYLATLAPLPAPQFVNRYEAESWIGTGARRPRVKVFEEGWPPQA